MPLLRFRIRGLDGAVALEGRLADREAEVHEPDAGVPVDPSAPSDTGARLRKNTLTHP